VASGEEKQLWGTIPGKHTNSAQVIEKEGDGRRSGAKERPGV